MGGSTTVMCIIIIIVIMQSEGIFDRLRIVFSLREAEPLCLYKMVFYRDLIWWPMERSNSCVSFACSDSACADTSLRAYTAKRLH